MKILLCPPGYVRTKVKVGERLVCVDIERLPHEVRGYTIVDNDVADALLHYSKDYEVISQKNYPRNIERLQKFVEQSNRNMAVQILNSPPDDDETVSSDAKPVPVRELSLTQKIGQAVSRFLGRNL